ncbi:hypothetical protein [Halorientalis salina]|uniref:hypothetical protein n=1 Tax=Halorientalis salina TaxID=2932266 RepID=UPI0010AD2759|nr:hypothetical protein [Halorientalis salina]
MAGRLVGRPASAVAVIALAVVAAVVTARRVAATDTYLQIQYALPTYDGSIGPIAVTAGAVLVGLAALSAYVGAGLAPTAFLAGGPVFGWAVNHFSSSITPQYAATFPLEMAVLYGGCIGLVGYLLGRGVRTLVPPSALSPLKS